MCALDVLLTAGKDEGLFAWRFQKAHAGKGAEPLRPVSICQIKGVFDMFYQVLIVTAEQYRDNIKAGRGVMLVVSGKPGEGGLADLPLFKGGDCQLRESVGEGFAALDLDKDQSFALSGDDIDFTTLAAEVSLDNCETVSLQKCCCQIFAAPADAGILLTFATFPSHANT